MSSDSSERFSEDSVFEPIRERGTTPKIYPAKYAQSNPARANSEHLTDQQILQKSRKSNATRAESDTPDVNGIPKASYMEVSHGRGHYAGRARNSTGNISYPSFHDYLQERELQLKQKTGPKKWLSDRYAWNEVEMRYDDKYSSLPKQGIKQMKEQTEGVPAQREPLGNANGQKNHNVLICDMKKDEPSSTSDPGRRERIKQEVKKHRDMRSEKYRGGSLSRKEPVTNEHTSLESPQLVRNSLMYLRSSSVPEKLQQFHRASLNPTSIEARFETSQPQFWTVKDMLLKPKQRQEATNTRKTPINNKPMTETAVAHSPTDLNLSGSQTDLMQALAASFDRHDSTRSCTSSRSAPVILVNSLHYSPVSKEKPDAQSLNLFETRRFSGVLLKPLLPLDLGDWKMLASHLKMDRYIDAIEVEVKTHGHSPIRFLMDQWWQSEGRKANMSVIKQALKKMGRQDVLDDLEDTEKEHTDEHWDQEATVDL